jgi:hypothetical protein
MAMTCDEVLSRAADLNAPPNDAATSDAAVAAHLAACAACRAALDEARDAAMVLRAFESASSSDELPPADAAAAWDAAASSDASAGGAADGSAQRPAVAPRFRIARAAGRIAAAVLAVIGVAALAGARVEASEQGAAFVLPLPWSARTADAPTSPRDAAVAALRTDVLARLDLLAKRLAETDAAQTARLDASLAAIDERGRGAAQTLLAEVALLRRDVGTLKWVQDSVAEAASMPALPDPR